MSSLDDSPGRTSVRDVTFPLPLTLDPSLLPNVVQFTVPAGAMDAIDFRAVVREASADGVERPRIEFTTASAAPGQVRVICRLEMALRLLCAWTALADQPAGDVRNSERIALVRLASGAAFMAYVRAAYDNARETHS